MDNYVNVIIQVVKNIITKMGELLKNEVLVKMKAERTKMSKTKIAYYAFTGVAIVFLLLNYSLFE